MENQLASIVLANKFGEEEDEDENVKDNWDDEDEEPPKPVEVQPKKSAAGNKSQKASGKASSSADNGTSKPLTASELRQKRLQEEKMQRESDLNITREMLGLEDKNISLEFPLNTKEDFDLFHKNLVTKLWCYEKNPYYLTLLDKIFRDLCVPLDSEEVKNLSSTLNALFNEKIKAHKAANTKGKKKSKGYAIKMERNAEAVLDNDYIGDDLDDIM